MKMIAAAIEKAGVYDGAAARDALLEVGQNYNGASGTITFDDKGDRVSSTFELWKVEKDAEGNYKNVRVKLVSI
jgi:ABC-type branched-subunit amino acid transport system substrate-binding protein